MLVFILMNDENAEYVTISYPRIQEENIEFKIDNRTYILTGFMLL